MSITIKNIIKRIIDKFYYVFDFFAVQLINPEKSGELKLGVVRVDNIGDFILWVSAYERIREDNSVLIASSSVCELAVSLKMFRSVVVLDRVRFVANPIYRINKITEIRRNKINILFNPIHARSSFVDDAIVRVSCAAIKVGCCCSCENTSRDVIVRNNSWYSEIIRIDGQIKSEHSRNLEAINYLTKYFKYNYGPVYSVFNLRNSNKEGYVVMMLGASDERRCWPVDKFIKLIREVYIEYGIEIVLCGAGGDCVKVKKVIDEIDRKIKIRNMCGKTTLKGLMELISQANIVVSNETSVIHMAAATNTASVCIAGGGHHGKFVPYPECFSGKIPVTIIGDECERIGCNWKCYRKKNIYPCIESISVEQVAGIIRSELAGC